MSILDLSRDFLVLVKRSSVLMISMCLVYMIAESILACFSDILELF